MHLFLILINSSYAQLPLDSTNVAYLLDTPALLEYQNNVSLSHLAGNDVTWDFGDIVHYSTETRTFTEAPEDAEFNPDYQSDSEFFRVDASGMLHMGYNLHQGDPFMNERPACILFYSTELGHTSTDYFSFTALATCPTTGSTQCEVMGNGTLILPSGVFTNVTRFQTTSNYTVDCYNGPTSWHDFTVTENYYFKPGCHIELLHTKVTVDEEWYDPYHWEDCSNPCLLQSDVTRRYEYISTESIPDLCLVSGCTDSQACNYSPDAVLSENCVYNATPCDDGDEFTENDIMINCICQGTSVGDFNEDGGVGIDDLLEFLGLMGCTGECPADFNNDLVVNLADLLIFLGFI